MSDGGRGSGTEPGPDHTFSKTLPHDPNVGAESNLQTGKLRHTEVKATCRRPRRKNGAGQDAVPKALNHHHTLQSYSNDGLAAFTAGTAYPCLHVTLKSFSWLLRAGWEAADRRVPTTVFSDLPQAGSLFPDWWLPGGDAATGGTAAGLQNQRGNPSTPPPHRGQTTLQEPQGAAQGQWSGLFQDNRHLV